MRRWLAVLALAIAARGVSAQATPRVAAEPFQVKAGVTVAPDTVKVGDPFRVTAGIRAPRGATIEFPRATDSSSAVQSLDPVEVRTSGDTTAVEQYADYRVAAWDVGSLPVRFEDAIVRVDGIERRVPLTVTVFVASVLPADSAKRVPKPQRDVFVLNPFPWWIVALIAAAIALGLLIWWWFKRRRRKIEAVVVDPFTRAQAEFQRIESLRLLDAGERGRYVTLMIEVLRDYLAARYSEASLALTSAELQRSVRGQPHIPEDRLTRVLGDSDLIKFARRPVSSDRAREIGREARAIVADEYKASQPAPEAAA